MKWIVAFLIGLLLLSNIYWFCENRKGIPESEITQVFERIADNQVYSSVKEVTAKVLEQKLWDQSRQLLKKRKQQPVSRIEVKSFIKQVSKVKQSTDRYEKQNNTVKLVKDIVDDQGLKRGVVKVEVDKTTSRPTSNPWSYTLEQLDVELEVVKTLDNKILVTGKIKDKKGNKAPLNIIDVKTIISRPVVPTHSGGLKPFSIEMFGLYGFGGANHGPGIGFGSHLFNYKYKNKEILRFAGIVLGMQAVAATATFHPVSYNLGHIIPLLKDTYVTFGVGVGYAINNHQVIPMFSLGIATTL